MNFKNIVWFIKAISYFVLLRSLGNNKFNSYWKLISRFYDPLAYKSDQNPTSPYKISTLSSKELMRIMKTINMGNNSFPLCMG